MTELERLRHQLEIMKHARDTFEASSKWRAERMSELEAEKTDLIDQRNCITKEWNNRGLRIRALEAGLREAYEHNQNMHCFKTSGTLNKALNAQTEIFRSLLTNPPVSNPESGAPHE